jgi:hypothetical protein
MCISLFTQSKKPDFDINRAWTLTPEDGFPCLRRNNVEIGSPDAFTQAYRFYENTADCTGAYVLLIDALEIYLEFGVGGLVSVDSFVAGNRVFRGTDYWLDCQAGGTIHNTLSIGDCNPVGSGPIGYGGSVDIEAI